MTNRDWSQNPPIIYEPYKSTVLRNPKKPLVPIPKELFPDVGPIFGAEAVGENDADLTRNARINGEPIGERIVITGRVLNENMEPIPNTLVEIWQANSAGRYVHKKEIHDAPLDPNFLGAGRTVTDDNGVYRFITLRPASYPWGNHPNAWRPAHVHFSLFGPSIRSRLITQMYFVNDPLFVYDPIFNAIEDKALKSRLIADFSIDETVPDYAHAYVWDIVLRGDRATPFDQKMKMPKIMSKSGGAHND